MALLFELFFSLKTTKTREARIFNLVCPEFSESYGSMQYLLQDIVLHNSLIMILLTKWYTSVYWLLNISYVLQNQNFSCNFKKFLKPRNFSYSYNNSIFSIRMLVNFKIKKSFSLGKESL